MERGRRGEGGRAHAQAAKPGDGLIAADTRTRILAVTAELAATRGYHATSTREIAEIVGVRQPSLFHHFDSKDAIFAELLDRNLLPAVARARAFAQAPGPVAPRLCAYVVDDLRDLAASPFDVRGLYVTELLDDPAFAQQHRVWHELGETVRRMIEAGIERGELRDVSLAHAERAIFGMVLATIWERDESADAAAWPETCAELILRALLRRPSTFAAVRRRAEAVLGAAGTRPPR